MVFKGVFNMNGDGINVECICSNLIFSLKSYSKEVSEMTRSGLSTLKFENPRFFPLITGKSMVSG